MKPLEKRNRIDTLIEKAVGTGVFPGCNYCWIEKDDVYYGSFGAKALYPEYEINELSTVYDIASLSKVVGTTMAVLKLIELKKLSLDDKACLYLPYLHPDVTIRDLCTHSSGYPALTKGTTEMTQVEPLLKDLMTCQLTYEPGSQVVYSDVGYMYLGFIIENIVGSMPKFLYETCFVPLSMLDTRYNHKEILRIAPTENFNFRGVIRGFCHDEKSYLLDGVAGHAGLYSTVKDLGRFAKMILGDGVLEGEQILSKESIKAIRTKMIPVDDDYRSIGWIIRKVNDQEVMYHTGYTGTHMLIDKNNDRAFILLSNRVHPTRQNTKIIGFRKELEAVLYEE